ncbi:hemolysin family protein [Eisenbergiella sp.]
MDDGGPTASILLFLGLLLLEAYCYGFGAAIHGLNEKEVERKAIEENDKRSLLLSRLVGKPSRYVNTVQLVVTFLNLCMGGMYLRVWSSHIRKMLRALAERQAGLSPFMGGLITAASLVITVILLLYILLVFGTLIPKKLASRSPEKWAYRMIKPVSAVMTIFAPLTGLFSLTAYGILKLFGMHPDEDSIDVTEEEIISMVNEGHEQGVIQASEAEMITNIFEFGDKRAEDIMTNRTNIVAIDCEMTFGDAIQFMLNGRNSRYPVYEENIDHIIGILHMKDALRRQSAIDAGMKVRDIPGLLRDARFIPETRKVDSLFKTMQSTKCQMVIVLDEYGQTAGMIAMEDILEEIVGNILDEYDVDESYIREKSKDEYIIEGKTPLEELEELFDISFDESEFETLNGFLIAKLEHIPEPDEQFDIRVDGYDFKVLSVENKMIKTVLVKKLPEESGAAGEGQPLSGKTEEDRRSSGQDKAGGTGNK